jgi:hypothetical protein
MSFELAIYGCIQGAFRYGEEDSRLFQRRNCQRLEALPVQREDAEDWETKPIITRDFCTASPQDETYLSQIIHFGGSYKCYTTTTWEKDWADWQLAFENILREMYWTSVTLHVESLEEPDCVCEWVATSNAIDRMIDEEKPIMAWEFHSTVRQHSANTDTLQTG